LVKQRLVSISVVNILVTLITDIAEQTNPLALNVTIEMGSASVQIQAAADELSQHAEMLRT